MGSVGAEYKRGIIRYFDKTTLETVDVVAPVKLIDDFTGKALDATNDWTVAGVNSGTAAVNAATGGTIRITTGAADDDDVDVASLLTFKAGKACCVEVRAAINDVAGTAMNIGFSDATGEAADLIACTFATTSLTSTATDCALFFLDADATSNTLRAVAVKNNTDGTVINTGLTIADAEYHIYRVEIDDDGTCYFYVDGTLYGTQATGITTTVDLCVYIGFINREGSANTMDIDYVKAWQAR